MSPPRKKQQGSSASAAAAPEVSGKGKEVTEDGKEKQRQKGKEKEVREADRKDPAKEKQKQKGKETVARSEEKQKGKSAKEKPAAEQQGEEEEELAAAAKSAGEQFFKIFFPNQSRERLKIPTAFHQHLKEQPTGPVSLKGPSGNTWEAVLTSDSEGLCFVQGWKEFVTDHSVQQGHFLVFTYDGLSQFSVTVFCSLGIVDPLALVAKPTNDVVIKIEDGEEDQEDMDAGGTSETSILPPEDSNGITGKRTSGVNDHIPDGKAAKKYSSVANKAEKKQPKALDHTSKDASTVVNTKKGKRNSSETSILPLEDGNGTTGKKTRGVNGPTPDGKASKKHSSVAKKSEKKQPEANDHTSKDASTVVNTEKGKRNSSETSILPPEDGNGITGKRTRGVNDPIPDGKASKKHSSVAKKSEKKQPEAIDRTSKDASTVVNTEKVIVKRTRQPVVISQRRPVTEEEKDLALTRAKEFKSNNPFAVQIMMESYVYVGFFMNITCEFVRESLPRTSKKMTLWDPLGKPWEVNYVYYSDRSVASFSGGWGKFALGNNLEKFDVCIFELFKEDNIKVHIYRVVPEITPLLRASGRS
ncbi:hypothetical protein HU200_029258 [Digitaria exilis]|uniref:TF-B3 domain-containing protein n=1 Tax=Digitaria exilis TaxID=1010633 RepID=A0A835ET69_9POAL|nr:hypothetical protein HU200_029258 [Digitaria exilis]